MSPSNDVRAFPYWPQRTQTPTSPPSPTPLDRCVIGRSWVHRSSLRSYQFRRQSSFLTSVHQRQAEGLTSFPLQSTSSTSSYCTTCGAITIGEGRRLSCFFILHNGCCKDESYVLCMVCNVGLQRGRKALRNSFTDWTSTSVFFFNKGRWSKSNTWSNPAAKTHVSLNL